MATIQERAITYREEAEQSIYKSLEDMSTMEIEYAYAHGATEQRDIDIEKATEWLNANWRKYIDTDADGMIRFSGWKKDFEKAMKDESNM